MRWADPVASIPRKRPVFPIWNLQNLIQSAAKKKKGKTAKKKKNNKSGISGSGTDDPHSMARLLSFRPQPKPCRQKRNSLT